jgi:hypothetical protein
MGAKMKRNSEQHNPRKMGDSVAGWGARRTGFLLRPACLWLFAIAASIGAEAQAAPMCRISHCRLQYVELIGAGDPHLEVWKGDNQDPQCSLDGCDVDDTFLTFTIVRGQCRGISLDDASVAFLDDVKARSLPLREPTCEPEQ